MIFSYFRIKSMNKNKQERKQEELKFSNSLKRNKNKNNLEDNKILSIKKKF